MIINRQVHLTLSDTFCWTIIVYYQSIRPKDCQKLLIEEFSRSQIVIWLEVSMIIFINSTVIVALQQYIYI